jgi:hypothetical protein
MLGNKVEFEPKKYFVDCFQPIAIKPNATCTLCHLSGFSGLYFFIFTIDIFRTQAVTKT